MAVRLGVLVTVGVRVLVGVFVRVRVEVGVRVAVGSINPVEVGPSVEEGKSAMVLSGVCVQVGGNCLNVGVEVGISTVGGI